MKKTVISILLFIIQSSNCYCQTDTIKIDAPVSLILEKELVASDYKTGDTIWVFTVTDDLKVKNRNGQQLLAVKKGAPAKAVVTSCILPHWHKQPRGARYSFERDEYYARDLTQNQRSGGEIVVTIVAVQAVNESFLPLSDCPIAKIGGIDGGYKKNRTMASIPAGMRKICNTQYPNAVLVF